MITGQCAPASSPYSASHKPYSTVRDKAYRSGKYPRQLWLSGVIAEIAVFRAEPQHPFNSLRLPCLPKIKDSCALLPECGREVITHVVFPVASKLAGLTVM